MLSQKTIDIVKSTAPILDQHAETLTRHFYKRMFAHNPEVQPFFNPAHQESGSQQRALAGAICAYAANIDNLDVLGGAVELIAQKHVSLMIQPDHYPIVGANLLASIREVLGEGATDDVIDAWAEAYHFLAGILIGREAQLYNEQKTAPHSWQGFTNFRVLRREKESDVITSFYLAPADGGQLPDFKPGQYVTVRVPTPCGHTTMRNYSLSDKPGQDHFRISVKREVGAKADTPKGFVSNTLHDHVEAGSVIELGAPCGEFFLDTTVKPDRPLVLLAGGIGITPLMSILLSALAHTPEREIILFHASLNENVQAFRATLDELTAAHPRLKVRYFYSEPAPAGTGRADNAVTGLIDAAQIEAALPGRDADYFFCGPKPFMVNIYHQLLTWGIPPAQVHFEFFGPRQELQKSAA
jgi:nitric oxide dioxygenase